MENNERKNNSLTELMEASMSKIRDMVDSNTIIGEPIQTPDGVTLIPVSRLSFGFGCGGKQAPKFGGASTAGVKVEPVAFLVVKDGVTRVMPVALPAVGTVDRVIDLVPQVMDRVESFIDKKKAEVGINVGAGLKLLNHLQVGANYNIPLGNTADIEGTNASYKTKTWQVSVAYIF